MIEIIKNIQSFTALSSQWNKLASSFNNPLFCHEWFSSCLNALYKEENIYVIVVRKNKEITAIAPLVLIHRNGAKWLELIGVTDLYEPSGLLYRDIEGLQKLARALINTRIPFVLSRVNCDFPIHTTLAQFSKTRGLLFNRETATSPLIECNSSWDEYYASMSARRRYDHRRAEKRAAKYGKISFEICTPTPENCLKQMDKAFDIEAAGWKSRKGSALKVKDNLRSFFLNYATQASIQGILRIFFLHIDGQPAAMQICVEHAERLWVLKIGYNEKWSECSPGILLTRYTIKYAFENDLVAYEFLGSDEPWVKVWARQNHEYNSIVFYPFSSQGLLGLGMDASRLARSKLTRHFTRYKRVTYSP